jgi:PhnB protein
MSSPPPGRPEGMTANLCPYLSFDGTAREAMETYQRVLGGTLTINTFAEFGMDGPDAERIMHSQLDTPDGILLMGSDTGPGMGFEKAAGTTVCISGTDTEKLRGWWAQLAEGAQVETPLAVQMWGDEYGALTDRFGTPWMFNVAAAAQEG